MSPPPVVPARDGSTADLSAMPLEQISLDGLDPQTLIAANFRVYELTRSEIAQRRGIDNHFAGNTELRAAVNLAREVLQRVRAHFGAFSPNSVYRSQGLERALKNKPSGWLSTSQHTRGEACDIEIPGVTTLALAQWAAENLPAYDQIICECYDPRQGPNSGWVHVSLKPPGGGENRRALLSLVRDTAGHMAYLPGLLAQQA